MGAPSLNGRNPAGSFVEKMRATVQKCQYFLHPWASLANQLSQMQGIEPRKKFQMNVYKIEICRLKRDGRNQKGNLGKNLEEVMNFTTICISWQLRNIMFPSENKELPMFLSVIFNFTRKKYID